MMTPTTMHTQLTQPDIAVAAPARARSAYSGPMSGEKSAPVMAARSQAFGGFGADLWIVAGVPPRGVPV